VRLPEDSAHGFGGTPRSQKKVPPGVMVERAVVVPWED
jgi:hypothetical protein